MSIASDIQHVDKLLCCVIDALAVLISSNSECIYNTLEVAISTEIIHICDGGSALISTSVTGGSGVTSYQWQIFNDPSWENILGEIGDIYNTDPNLASEVAYDYRVVVAQDSGCFATSNTLTISVNDDPFVGVNSSDVNITEAESTTITGEVLGGAGGNSYQWQHFNGVSWDDISGGNSQDYQVDGLEWLAGSHDFRLQVTQNTGCESTSDLITITIV